MSKKLLTLFSLLTVFATLFTLPVQATQTVTLSTENMVLSLPDDFTLITGENLAAYQELLAEYDTTVTQTQIKFQENNYLFMGISQTMQYTITLSCVEDSVSATIGDLISYSQQQLAKDLLLGTALDESMVVQELEQRGALFYKVNFGVQNKIGRLAYITVLNGKCYTLSLIDNTGALNNNARSLFNHVFETWEYTVQAEKEKIDQFRQQITQIFYWICLPITVGIGVILLRLLWKDIALRRQNQKRKDSSPKKPRR